MKANMRLPASYQ